MDPATLRFRTVIEYFSSPEVGDFHDPRKHAVALTYSALATGEAEPKGEARAFTWFHVNKLSEVAFGFGQGDVASRVFRAVGGVADESSPRRVF